MPSVNYGWGQIARKRLHADLARRGVSVDFDDMPAMRRAVARVLERPLPENIEEQDDLLRRFSNGDLVPPLHEFEPIKHKPWDSKRFQREWGPTLEKLGRRP